MPNRPRILRQPLKVYQSVRFNEEDARIAAIIQEDFQELIRKVGLHEVKVEMGGSSASEVGVKGADVDLVLLSTSERPLDEDLLQQIDDKFPKSSKFRLLTNIYNARVPILRLRHIRPKRSVDVSLNNTKSIQMAHLHKVLAEKYPTLKPMTACIKNWTRAHRLKDSTSGYFNGFSLSLMVIFHQQKKNGMPALSIPPSAITETEIRSAITGSSQLAVTNELLKAQLIDFFRFFANFDYRQAMDIQSGCETERPSKWESAAVVIINPVDNDNNAAACVGERQLKKFVDKFTEIADRCKNCPR